MFKGLKFSVLEFGMELSVKRAKVLSDIILKHDGKLIPIKESTNFLILVYEGNQPDLIISSKKLKFETFYNVLQEKNQENHIKKLKEKVVQPEWVTDCIKAKNQLHTLNYKVEIATSSNCKIKRAINVCEEDKKGKWSCYKNSIVESITDEYKETRKLLSRRSSRLQEIVRNAQLDEQRQDGISISNDGNKLFDQISNNLNYYRESSDECTENEENEENFNNSLNTKNFSLLKSSLSQSKYKYDSPPEEFTSIHKIDKAKFAFHSTSSRDSDNKNGHITSQLEKVLEYHSTENNVFQAMAYRKALSIIKALKEKIESCEQLKKVKNLSKAMKEKVKEILKTGKLKKGEFLNQDEKNKAVNTLSGVWGIGLTKAKGLYSKGLRSIEDLRKNETLLNPHQLVGLKYYDDLIKRIPRDEVYNFAKIVERELSNILPEEVFHFEICGSFRRGKKTCGDMDLLISRTDGGEVDGILTELVEQLSQKKFITEILSLDLSMHDKYQFMGICKLDGNPHRRIDIKVYKKKHFPFALLYFTGSAYFNRSLRLYAKKLGFQLSDTNLVIRNTGKSFDCKSEEEIFKALGLDYKSPEQRDI